MNNPSFPRFRKIALKLQEDIDNRLYPPGCLLPSERELMAKYGVSRNTAHNALDLLVRKGLVHQVQGKGSFVNAARGRYGTVELMGFSEEVLRKGQKPGSKILSTSIIKSPINISEILRINNGDNLIFIDRIRYADDTPIARSKSYIPEKYCPNFLSHDLSEGSIFKTLEEFYNLKIAYSDQSIKSIIADEEDANALGIPRLQPLLSVNGVTYLEGFIPIEISQIVYRSDYYAFHYVAVRRT